MGTGSEGKAHQGNTVALSSDGNPVLFTGVTDDTTNGAAWVFIRSSTSMQQKDKLEGMGVNSRSQDGLITMSGDGSTLAIGGNLDHHTGGGLILTRTNGNGYSKRKDWFPPVLWAPLDLVRPLQLVLTVPL